MIRKLPKDVVDRIAAGEVIERPASVVKELVENALDAGATRIEVEIEGGGKQKIRVSDDGCGMSHSDLELAFVPHATSKLSAVDDLLAIASYGFRGEALASVGTVSRARVTSRTREEEGGHEIVCDGGEISEVRPCGVPLGTQIEVQNLFFNVPARSRFMKGDAAETSRCLDHVVKTALANVGVGFSLSSSGRQLFTVAPQASRRERVAAAHGRELGEAMIETELVVHEVRVQALLGTPSVARGRAMRQYIFLNGRSIQDATIKAAIRQAYREFLAPSLQPVFVIMVHLDPSEVDVNVHPAKTEVRFRDPSRMFRAVHRTVLDALRSADLAPRPGVGYEAAEDGGVRRALSSPSSWTRQTVTGDRNSAEFSGHSSVSDRDSSAPIAESGSTSLFDEGDRPPVPSIPMRTGATWLRLFETYIAYEAEGEMVLVDQHALHERVLYEKLRTQSEEGSVASQRLLVPETVEVGKAAVIAFEEKRDELLKMGLEVSPLGEDVLAVHGVPAALGKASASMLLDAAMGGFDPMGHEARQPREDRLHHMACRGAVKAGDYLEDGEIEALLGEAAKLPEAKACPHGRPTSIRLSLGDLERWFKRRGF